MKLSSLYSLIIVGSGALAAPYFNQERGVRQHHVAPEVDVYFNQGKC